MSFILTVVFLRAQPPAFKWVDQFRVIQAGTDKSSAVDRFGNVYLTGTFYGTVDFDPGPGIFNLTAPIDDGITVGGDMFIVKLSAGGELLWAKKFGGKDCVTGGLSLAVDKEGNVYSTGTVYNTRGLPGAGVDFDPGPDSAMMILTSKSYDAFISKLDGCGNFVWIKQISGIDGDRAVGKSITIDENNNIYLLGDYAGANIDFDPGPSAARLFTNYDVQRIVVCKYDAAGNFSWAKQMEPNLFGNVIFGAKGNSIAADAAGNSYITGIFVGDIDFDPGPQQAMLSANTTYGNSYIVKLDPYGNLVWAKQAGKKTSSRVYGSSIAVDSDGNVYTAGSFNGSADFDPGPGEYLMNNSDITHQSIYVYKLNGLGEFVWAKQLGDTSLSMDVTIVLDGSGNIYAAGNFSGSIDADPGPDVHPVQATGLRDVFVLKLNPAGGFEWVQNWGGQGNADAYALSLGIDAGRNIITTGTFLNTIDFDPGTAVSDHAAQGASDIFVHKLGACTANTFSTLNVTECNSFTLNCKPYTASGTYTQTLLNAAGCDSVITLHLTVLSPADTISVRACDTYAWHNRTFTGSGFYSDTLKSSGGCDSIVTLALTMGKSIRTELNVSICSGNSFEGYTTSGSYTNTFFNAAGCDSVRLLNLTVLSGPAPDLGADLSICAGDSVRLSPGTFQQYTWQDGSTGASFMAAEPGRYTVTVSDSCGTASDVLLVTNGICDLYFPSAFSPNQDGRNDVFRVVTAKQLQEYSLVVYNRWGQAVYETRDRNAGWDGNLQGRSMEAGVYAWFCRYRKRGSTTMETAKGTVYLTR